MTKIDIEQIKADREAGTQGPFVAERDNCDNGSGQWYDVGPYRVSAPYNLTREEALRWEADARRAERIQETEAALIEAFRVLEIAQENGAVNDVSEFLERFQ